MGYSLRRLHDTTDKEIKEILDIQDIIKLEAYCKEAEEEIKNIRLQLFEQVQRLNEIKSEKYILIRRYVSWYQKKVEVFVSIEESKQLGEYKRTWGTFNKKFGGNEKKQAVEYAKELQKIHNLKIVKENWK